MARDLVAEYFTDLDTLRDRLGYSGASPSDEELNRIAQGLIRWFEERTRQSHVPLAQTRRFFGDGTRTLRLDRAIITITSITVTDEAISLDNILGAAELGPGIDALEWHRDPRLVLDHDHADLSYWPLTSYRDIPNIVIVGIWGACSGDADAPVLPSEVEEALLRLINDNCAPPADLDVRLAKRSPTLGQTSEGGRTGQTSMHGRGKIAVDPFVEAIIYQHRAPDRMATTMRPSLWS